MNPSTTSSASADSRRSPGGSRARAVGVAVGLAVVAFVVSLVAGVVLAVPVFVYGLDVGSAPVFLGLTAAGQVAFLAVALGYARRYGLPVRIERPTRRQAGLVAAGVVAAVAVAVGGTFALAALDLLPGSVIGEAAADDPVVLIGLAALSVVLIAPAEEFLFRGVIQGRLRRAFGPAGAVAGSSLVFGSMHLANYTGSVVGVLAGALLIAAVGAVFGALYERTRNLAVPIAVHALYNALLLGVGFLGY